MARTEVSELKETLREKDFKLRAVSLILTDLLANAPASVKSRAHAALFTLSYMHTSGERPYIFKYNGHEVRVD